MMKSFSRLAGVGLTALLAATSLARAADTATSGLNAVSAAAITDVYPVLQGGTLQKETLAQMSTALTGNATFQGQIGSIISAYIVAGTNVTVTTATGHLTIASSGGGSAQAAQIDFYSATGTWTKATGFTSKTVDLIAVAPGGGGGSGRRGAAASVRGGGGGGGGGQKVVATKQATDLGATETVTIGAAGTGGAAVTTDSTDGNPGVTAGNVTFGTHLIAQGGLLGNQGTVSGGIGGVMTNYGAPILTGTGASGGTGAVGGNGTNPVYGGGGGAGGGSISSGDASFAGGQGATGGTGDGGAVRGTAGANTGGAGGAGVAGGDLGAGGGGGGGGGANLTGAAGAGGAGGAPGGGGGGGGASLNGNASGAGGTGGTGLLVAIQRP